MFVKTDMDTGYPSEVRGSMEKIDGITRRVAKLEGGHKYPPLIVWKGDEQSIRPKPGRKFMS